MKTACLLGLLIASTSVLSPAALADNRRCESVFTKRPSVVSRMAGGAHREIENWSTDAGFAKMLSHSEKMGQVKSVYNRKLETRFYYGATALPDGNGHVPMIDPEAKAVVVFFHGSGTANSSGINFSHNINRLASVGIEGISFDMPFHADGPRRDQYRSADFFMNWIHEVLRPMRESGKPVYLVGHSFGPEVISEYLYRFPNDVQGATLLSPVGFNKTLREWQDKKTSKMSFGGDVAENTAGGQWADEISRKFTWNLSGGEGDPTVANPNLRVEVLSGDREEYVPAPLGGKKGTPIGKNTYDLKRALQPFFKNAHIVVEPGIGHYLFAHADAKGDNVAMRSIYSMMGINIANEVALATETANVRSARPFYVKLEREVASNPLMQSWLVSTDREAAAYAAIRSANNEVANKILNSFLEDFKARVRALRY